MFKLNRPFYSCVLDCLAFEWNEAGGNNNNSNNNNNKEVTLFW